MKMLPNHANYEEIHLEIQNVKGRYPEVDREIASLWDLGDENSIKAAGRLVNYIHARLLIDSIEREYPKFRSRPPS
jgi:hypothetical protein